jgi:hypothetical protein
MSNRDAFESAFCDYLMGATKWAPDYLYSCRVSDTMYNTSEVLLTAVLNGAWWSWNTAQQNLIASHEGSQHVVH